MIFRLGGYVEKVWFFEIIKMRGFSYKYDYDIIIYVLVYYIVVVIGGNVSLYLVEKKIICKDGEIVSCYW